MRTDIKATILSLISVAVSLLALNFEEQRIAILILYSITLVGYFLFTYLARIDEHEKQINDLKESFKRAEDLIIIRTDIEDLKRMLNDG